MLICHTSCECREQTGSSSAANCTAGEESAEEIFTCTYTTHEGSGTNAGSSFFDTVPSLLSHLRTPSHSNIIQYNYGSIFLFTKTLLMSINGKILGIIAIFIKHNEFFVAS